MTNKTKEFLEMFSTFNNEDKRVIFADVFSEFIEELNLVDLSKETLQHLNDIFEKDMKLFFKKLDKFKGDDEK